MSAAGACATLGFPALARPYNRRRPDTRSVRTPRSLRLTRVRPTNNAVVAASEGDMEGNDVSSSDASTQEVSSDNDGNSFVDPNQPSFDNRWGGSDDEDDSHAAARTARIAAAGHGQVWDEMSSHTHDTPLKNNITSGGSGSSEKKQKNKKTYSDDEIASMQIDAIKHAAVVDSIGERLDREEREAEEKNRDQSIPPSNYQPPSNSFPNNKTQKIPTPEYTGVGHASHRTDSVTDSVGSRSDSKEQPPLPARPPHAAVPTDTNSKACICRYTYDRNALDLKGEPYTLERYDLVAVAKIGDTPNATIDDLVPGSVRHACKCVPTDGFANTVCMQSFDWNSSKMFDNHPRDETSEDFEKPSMSYWRWLTDRVDSIATLGVTHVWLPPPSQSVSPEGYLPGRLFNLDASAYGTKQELITLNITLKENGITPVCDVVINHRTAEHANPEGIYNVYTDLDQDGTPVHWDTWAITCDDPEFYGKGGPDSGENYGPAPDLDHTNPELRKILKRWMAWLRDDVGFGGFRFDFVRGYAPEYVLEYVRSTFPPVEIRVEPTHKQKERARLGMDAEGNKLSGLPVDPALLNPHFSKNANPVFNVGEFWVDMTWEGSTLGYDQDGPRAKLVDWIADTEGSCALFDFPTKGILQRAVTHTEFWRLRDKASRPPGLLGWVPQRSVTFVDNHDTGAPQNHWPFPTDRLGLGYAYVLTHPGIPCVFGPHVWGDEFGNDGLGFLSGEILCDQPSDPEQSDAPESIGPASLGSTIQNLLHIRKRNNITADSSIKILLAESDIYVARVGHALTVKLGPKYDMPVALVPPDPEWSLAASGTDWAVWERVDNSEYASSPYASSLDSKSEYKFTEEDDDNSEEIASAVRKAFGVVDTDEKSFPSDTGSPVLVGGALDEQKNAPSIGSFFEVPEGFDVKPNTSYDEDEEEEEEKEENPR